MAYVSYSILSAASFLLVTWFISATPTVNAFLTSPLRRPPRAFTAAAAAKSRGGYDASTHVPGRGRDKATVRTMASRDEELESLRRENESLKEELWASSRRSKPPVEKGSFNPLKALGKLFLPELKSAADNDGDNRQGETEIVSSTSSSKRTKRNHGLDRGGTDAGSALDQIFKGAPFPLNLAGGLVKGMASMIEETFQESEDDVELVIRATERALQRDEQASLMLGGGDAKCLSPVGKSYAKSTINGISSVSIGLQMPVRGTVNQGSVSVKASVGGTGTGRTNNNNSKVTLKAVNLIVNGTTISVKPTAGGGEGMENPPRRAPGANTDGGGDVVDVEYTER